MWVLSILCGSHWLRANTMDSLELKLQIAQAQHVDSLLSLIDRMGSSPNQTIGSDGKLLAKCFLVEAYVQACEYDQATALFEGLLSTTPPGTELRAKALSSGARLYYRLPNAALANRHTERSIALYDSLQLPIKKLWASLYHLGPLKSSNAQKAMEKVLDALSILKRYDAPLLERWYLFELALLNQNLGNKQEAERIVAQLLKETKALNEAYLKTQLLSFKANLLPAEERKKQFLEVAHRFHQLRDHFNEAQVYMRLSLSDMSKSSEEALRYLGHATTLSDSLQIPIAQLPLFQSWHYAALGQSKKGIRLAKETLNMASRWGRRKNAYQASDNLARFYAEIHQYDSAYHYQSMAARILREISPRESAVLAGRMEAKMATEALLEEQKKTAAQQALLHEKELNQQKWVRNIWTGASLLLVAVLALIIRNYLRQKRSKALVERQKQDLERLDQLNREVFSVIAHDFKGPMVTMGILANTLSSVVQPTPNLIIYQNDLKSQIEQTQLMLENLLNWARAELAVSPQTAPICEPHAICEEILHDVKSIAYEKQVQLENHLPSKATAPIHADVLRIVWRNLIGNAVKFSRPSQKVVIGFKEGENTFFVEDHGVGIPNELQDQLFQQSVVSEPGTEFETGFGLGLFISHELLHKSGWWIEAKSVIDQGSTFQFGPQKLTA